MSLYTGSHFTTNDWFSFYDSFAIVKCFRSVDSLWFFEWFSAIVIIYQIWMFHYTLIRLQTMNDSNFVTHFHVEK